MKTTSKAIPAGNMIAVADARRTRLGGISMPTIRTWVRRGILPKPIRPTGGTKGRLYWRVDELEATLAKINAA
jgi:hypothetical protein